MNKKTKRDKNKEKDYKEENKKNKLKKDNSLNKNFISLVKHKSVSLVKKLNCEKRNLSKSQYSTCEYSYEMKKIFNKDDKNKIKKIHILSKGNKKKVIFLTNDNLMIYEIKDDSTFNLNFVKKISHNAFFSNDNIKFHFIFKYKNDIMFNLFNFRQIILFLFDYDKNAFIAKKCKDYSKDKSNKYFYYMKKSNKFLIYKSDQAVIYNALLTERKTLIALEENYGAESIQSWKELNTKILCLISSNSVSVYNLGTEKFIGTIINIIPKSIKLIKKKNGEQNLMILSYNIINLYELEKLTIIQELNISNKLKNIEKIKQLSNLDICIIYSQYNLAIYDLQKNLIKYQIKNETKNYIYYYKYFYIKEISKNILIYNPTRYSLHIIDYSKGQTIAKFKDGLNKIQSLRKIKIINADDIYDEKILKEKIYFFFIINLKGYFVLKINDLK